jgi:hypothetical protein
MACRSSSYHIISEMVNAPLDSAACQLANELVSYLPKTGCIQLIGHITDARNNHGSWDTVSQAMEVAQHRLEQDKTQGLKAPYDWAPGVRYRKTR